MVDFNSGVSLTRQIREEQYEFVLRAYVSDHPEAVGALALLPTQDKTRRPAPTPAVTSIELALDGATGDYSTSGDAMRWCPDLIEEQGGRL